MGDAGPAPLRLALLADFVEEGWPSMDLCAEMLLRSLERRSDRVQPVLLRAPYAGRFGRLPLLGGGTTAKNLDRFLGRFLDYPRWVRRVAPCHSLFHVVDHSYAALVLAVPAGRAGVYCHDLDAFRCLLEPWRDPRPPWFRALARRILAGLQHAAIVFHSTAAVREELLRHALVPVERLVHAPLGVSPDLGPEGDLDAASALPWLSSDPFLLHVGSTIPRKRVDVLLRAFSTARGRLSGLRLVQVGGAWTQEQKVLMHELRLGPGEVLQVRGLPRESLAALYRGARGLLLPSQAEGFGLPLLEALACGAPVLASDLPALREVGGAVVSYLPVGGVEAWGEAIGALLGSRDGVHARAQRVAHAARFSWDSHAETVLGAYERLSS